MRNKKMRFVITLSGRTVFVLYTLTTVIVYMLPQAKVKTPYLVAGLLMLAFLPVAMIKDKQCQQYTIILLGTSSLLFFFNIISGIFSRTEAINELIRNVRFFLPALWTLYALKYCTNKQNKRILLIYGLITGYILIKTMAALEQDQWITRILAQSKMADNEQIRAYRLGNVGGFEFSYMMGILTLIATWFSVKCKKASSRIISIGITVISFYYIIQTMYTTLLLITSIGILLLLLLNTKSPTARVLMIAAYLGLLVGLAPLFRFLSGVFVDSLLSTKFTQLYNALSGAGADALGSRPGYIMTTIQNWSKSPIFGGYASTYSAHSLIFGLLETNGIIGLSCWLVNLFGAVRLIDNSLKGWCNDTALFKVVILYVVLLAILNPIGYVFEVMIAALFITPMCLSCFCNTERQSEKSRGAD